MAWADAALPGLGAEDRRRLDTLPVLTLPAGARLFGPGEAVAGFAVVLSGRVEVSLTGPSGREILLYAVEPGESCVQTTLGLMGGAPYSAEAVCATEVRLALIPPGLFQGLMDGSDAFRRFVFRAFAARMTDMTALLERVAFARVEARLAEALLALAEGDVVSATHAELAARIGSAREVVSRRLEALVQRGLVRTERGQVHLRDRAALRMMARDL